MPAPSARICARCAIACSRSCCRSCWRSCWCWRRQPRPHNDGRGFYGATNDKVVTNAGFILIVFFPVFIFLMSMLQGHLEKRKEARKAAAKALLGNAYMRGGW